MITWRPGFLDNFPKGRLWYQTFDRSLRILFLFESPRSPLPVLAFRTPLPPLSPLSDWLRRFDRGEHSLQPLSPLSQLSVVASTIITIFTIITIISSGTPLPPLSQLSVVASTFRQRRIFASMKHAVRSCDCRCSSASC